MKANVCRPICSSECAHMSQADYGRPGFIFGKMIQWRKRLNKRAHTHTHSVNYAHIVIVLWGSLHKTHTHTQTCGLAYRKDRSIPWYFSFPKCCASLAGCLQPWLLRHVWPKDMNMDKRYNMTCSYARGVSTWVPPAFSIWFSLVSLDILVDYTKFGQNQPLDGFVPKKCITYASHIYKIKWLFLRNCMTQYKTN